MNEISPVASAGTASVGANEASSLHHPLSARERWFLGRQLVVLFWSIAVAVIIVTAAVVASVTWQSERDAAARVSIATANQYATNLLGLLDKFRLLTPLLSQNQQLLSLFLEEGDNSAARRILNVARGMSGARQIRFLGLDGNVIAASAGYGEIDSFPNESHRNYFADALQGRLGRGHSINGGERLYHFATRATLGSDVEGVIVADVSLTLVEQNWALTPDIVFATDQAGTIFMGNRENWILKYLEQSEEVADEAIFLKPSIWGADLVSVQEEPISGSFLHASQPISILNWELHILHDIRPLIGSVAGWTISVTFAMSIIAVMFWTLLASRRSALAAHRRDLALSLRLERRVRDRTQMLTATNDVLAREIEVRRRAEDELRRVQEDLLHSAKLAAIGQTSAALGHEFNQPLSAIRFNAENAARLMERGAVQRVEDKLAKIISIVDRMGSMSKMLRMFATRPKIQLLPIQLRLVLDEVTLLIADRLEANQVILSVNVEDDVMVKGDIAGLLQIFLNLLGNGCEALSASEIRRICISAKVHGSEVIIRVSDTGPGIPPNDLPRLFEPFFTTKSIGNGLGLGLAIVKAIVQEHGGQITATNRETSGAVFELRLAAPDLGEDDVTWKRQNAAH